MQKQIWLCSLIIFASLLQSKTEVLACGDYGTTSEEFEAQLTKHLTDRMLSLTAIRNPIHDQWQEITRITEQLRTLGQPGLNAIIKSRKFHADQGSETFQLDRLDKQIDIIAGQKNALACQLFWHKSLADAKAQAITLGRPILSLRMLGHLDEDLSCANSRFFREILYADDAIAECLRENFVLHWKPVCDVPVATIDFGNGRKLRQPIIGNSVHLVLTGKGRVVDGLPGLVTQVEFMSWLDSVFNLHGSIDQLPDSEQNTLLQAWHRNRAQLRRQRSELAIHPDESVGDLNPLDPKWRDAAGRNTRTADSLKTIRLSESTPLASAAMRIAPLKMAAELPVFRMVDSAGPQVEQDSLFNLYGLQTKLDDWYIQNGTPGNYEQITNRIYKELFLMPLDDPWLGLSPEDSYMALDNKGRHLPEHPDISAIQALNPQAN